METKVLQHPILTQAIFLRAGTRWEQRTREGAATPVGETKEGQDNEEQGKDKIQ